MKPVIVDSSTITALAYKEGDFFVRFKGSGTYMYKGVPVEVAAQVTFADSPGSALHKLVKSAGYAVVKLEKGVFDDEKEAEVAA